MAGNTILIYDFLLTFDLEMDNIWSTPWTTVKVLFLLNRYGTLIGQSFITVEELGILGHSSRKFCLNFQWFLPPFVFFLSETTRTLLLLRAWSLWRCSRRIAVSLVSAYVFYVVMLGGTASYIMFQSNATFHFPHLEETGVCVASAAVTIAWLLGFISFLLDTGIFAVTGYFLYRFCREAQPLQESPLIRLLVRDAVLFYVVTVFDDVLGIVTLSALVNNPLYFMQIALSFPLLVVAGQRAVLNLRGFQSTSYSTREISRFVDGQFRAMQSRSFWQSVDHWMNDLHQELELAEDSRYRTTTTGSYITATEASSHELEVIHTLAGSGHMPATPDYV
ncbi:hypothetical protein OG21DRAFT_1507215 [Imleria badia]|nr:hypothetical protein OG21DRAFT_1507215 [Imleria badia]